MRNKSATIIFEPSGRVHLAHPPPPHPPFVSFVLPIKVFGFWLVCHKQYGVPMYAVRFTIVLAAANFVLAFLILKQTFKNQMKSQDGQLSCHV